MVSLIFDFKQVYCNNIQALISSTLHTGSPETKLNTTERSYLWSAMSSNKSISKVSSRPSSGWTKTLINHHDLIFFAKIIHINMLEPLVLRQTTADLASQDDIEGCSPTGLSTGRPGLHLPFPACRVVGTVHWAAPNAVLFFATLFNARAAPWRPVASSLPQATEFNPGTELPKRWWKTAGQPQDYQRWLSSLSAT